MAALRRTGWVWHERYAWHNTGYGAAHLPASGWIQPGLSFAESAGAKQRFRDLVAASGLADQLVPIAPRLATEAELLRLHTADYVDHIKSLSSNGGGRTGAEGDVTPVGDGSYEIAVLAVGGALAAVEAVVAGDVENAYALIRPPGHHAEAGLARGFCLFGNTALAAMHARQSLGIERVAIVDWDVHHGNGTEDAFYEDPSVLTISLHGDGDYPTGRGAVEDRGAGAGEGFNINIPLPEGSGSGAYVAAFERVVVPALRAYRPELVLVASGLDAGAMDPLGRQVVHSDGFREMTRLVREAAAELCQGRLVCIHEGGYSEAYAPFCGVAVVEELCGERVVEDPFLAAIARKPSQALQPHQDVAIARSEALLPAVGGPG
jgi:acetoin utilization deacetylase AcuC-like enzyme